MSLRSTLKLGGFVQFVFEAVECRAMCVHVCVVPFLSYFELDCSRK